MTHEEFHSRVAPTAISNVACVGTENELISCSYSHLTTCGLLNDAGVICQGIRILFLYMSQFTYIFVPVPTTSGADCVTGDVRLADSIVDAIRNTTKGTLQICINKAWGAVCHDDLFGVADARVACQQAGGYEREIVDSIESAAITGPVFVSQLGCEGDETSLLDCRSYTYIGSGCVTADNAVIKCRGMNKIVTKIIQHGWTAEKQYYYFV